MSPGNKADLVSRIKKHYPDTTLLAIGDGANDVNMIAAGMRLALFLVLVARLLLACF